MKRLLVIITAVMLTMGISAQDNKEAPKFSPEQFDAELQDFITKEAKLTPQEAAKFFPVYKEMQAKQRAVFERQKAIGLTKPQDEKACLQAIRERDETDLEIKRILKTYHEKFLEMMPASKVYDIIRAEDRFHRHMLKKWSHYRFPQNQGNPGSQNRPQRKPQK
jgi:hypothetical protein